ncbi:MAG: Fic family protein [Candidatus Methanomethylophilaceae archaeon]|nr:Fic family protein [Candidatus Methanomethylophilaceae archaeon]MBR6205446.1 Fic family protein [Candidatus Methanomethylophilaceae archaeon]
MDETRFKSKISGEVRISNRGFYAYFQPHDLPFEMNLSPETRKACNEALMALSRLDGRSSDMSPKERNTFLLNFTLKESVHSSSIEGTTSTLSDMFLQEVEDVGESVRRNAKEVSNYRDALELGMQKIEESRRVDIELLHSMHKVLMDSVRGGSKSPGEFKTEQNAIGRPGDTLDSAPMVPAPPESVEHLIENLIEYIDSYDDPIVKAALVHYQFEAIHPYRDGNGRMGRLLIMLLLRMEGVLAYPMIYPSEYFDRNRDQYIDALSAVSSDDKIEEWIEFFAIALKSQAEDSMNTINALRSYRDRLKKTYGKSTTLIHAIDLSFSNPYIRPNDLSKVAEVTHPTAIRALKDLESEGILREITGRSRNMVFLAEGVLEILSGKKP